MSNVALECVVLDCPDPHALARFYAELLGWQEVPEDHTADWVTLRGEAGGTLLGFQRDPEFQPPTWPSRQRQQMAHLDFRFTDPDAKHHQALAAGAALLDDGNSGFWVYADPAGHPFCLLR